ncbi:MAG: glycine dehydrogenase, partial [Candidatus Omnitrophica bacterium]|nr:glycine dehydrogenase [Candidatus Omnitrophota bacterium]
TYLRGTNFEAQEIGFKNHFELNLDDLKKKLSNEIACVVVSNPNFFGLVEDLKEVESLVRQNGSLLILVGHPLSFGFYKTPKEWGADIACGEGQPLGIPISFGGPWLGYIATTRSLMRRIPGRLVGLTQDSQGRRAFCLTLQAREQHIRRERASSNICTNQALCAIAACVYLASLGKMGIRRIAELNMENANYLRSALSSFKELEVLTQGPIFNEFAVRSRKTIEKINEELLKKGIVGGFALERYYPELKNQMLLCATETKSKDDLDQLVRAFKEMFK